MTAGLPSAGKTTFCRQQLLTNYVYISPEFLAPQQTELLIRTCIQANQQLIIDAPNLSRDDRAKWQKYKPHDWKSYCFYFPPNIDECLERNRQREKGKLPAHVISNAAMFWREPELEEGFHSIFKVTVLAEKNFSVLWEKRDA